MNKQTTKVTYDIRPLQLQILNNLLALDRVCKEHNLHYYITAGTLLGAVRHKGFIPWDDDLDVGMPREDYDKLIENSKEWLPHPYELVSGETDEKYTLPFAKLQDANTTLIERVGLVYLGGAYIDVFPIDGVPEGKWSQKWHFAKYRFYRKMLYFHYRDPYKHGKNYTAIPTLICRRIMPSATIHRKLRKILTKYKYAESSLVADYDDYGKGVMPKNVFENIIPILFEGKEVSALKDYDTYLTKKYGDYMQIPKREKQIQHNFYYLDINTPYSSVKNLDEFISKIKEEKATNPNNL